MAACGPARGGLFPVACGGGALAVFAGLPGSGKSVLARGVAEAIRARYLRIDTIEPAIVSTLMPCRDDPAGYLVAGRVAAGQLAGGRDVVGDAVNGVAAARAGWVALAAQTGARCSSWKCGAVTQTNTAAASRRASHRCPGTACLRRRRCCAAATSHGRRSCLPGSPATTSATRPVMSGTSSPG
jgi:predicted kinase